MKAMVVGTAPGAKGLAERLAPFVKRVGDLLEKPGCTLSVMLTDDTGIARYNEQFRGKAEATDVLSFPSAAGSEADSGHYLGDLVVSFERAQAQAAEQGHSPEEEVEVLVLHGLLHLLGHDHENDAGEMRALEARLAAQLFGSLRGLTERAEDDRG